VDGTVQLIFITGGVRSGKSKFAEKIATELSDKIKGKLHYIAAGQESDLEMTERIKRHRLERMQRGYKWTTWEKPTNLGKLASQFKSDDIVLLDCLTTWLNNELFYQERPINEKTFQRELIERMLKDIDEISCQVKFFIIVSNEIQYEPVGKQELILTYCRLLSQLHQRIVANSSKAYLIETGIPILMKGEAG
jgi:adenosylcobinamide kinase / adenosylcobinamide-phosphate guanylyltransferase